MKKKVLLLVALVAVFGLALTACGNNDEPSTAGNDGGGETPTQAPGDNGGDTAGETPEAPTQINGFAVPDIPGFPLAEPLTVRVMGPHVGASDWEDMAFWQSISAATNMQFEFITPSNQDFLTNLNLAFVTGELPDMFFGSSLSAAQQMEHGSVGTLIPLQDLVANYGPNISGWFNELPHMVNSITAPDGNIFALPTIDQSFSAIWPVGPVYWNGSWLEALDAEVPRTIEDFTALLFRMRDEMPDILGVSHVYPISATDEMTWLRVWLISIWGMAGRGVEATDGVVVHNATTEAYRAYMEWMNMAFEEGLIHPEIFTLSGDMQGALGRENRIGLFQAWHSYGFLDTDQENGMTNPIIRPITSEWSPNGVLPRSPGFSFGQFAITDRASNPEALVRLFDWFYTEEGAVFANHGPEGAFWEYAEHAVTGETVRVFTAAVDPEDGQARGRFTPYFGFPAPQLIPQAVMPPVLRDIYQEQDTRFIDWLREETFATMGTYGKVAMPPAMLTEEEVQRIQTINADVNMELNRQEAAFITGLTPLNDDTWQAFQDALVANGVEAVVEVWQAAHTRWLAGAQ